MRKILALIGAITLISGCGGSSGVAGAPTSTSASSTGASSASESANSTATPIPTETNLVSAMYSVGQSLGTELVTKVYLQRAAEIAGLTIEQVQSYTSQVCADFRESANGDELKPKAKALRDKYGLSSDSAAKVMAVAVGAVCPDLMNKLNSFN